jgi:hypothetical protein
VSTSASKTSAFWATVDLAPDAGGLPFTAVRGSSGTTLKALMAVLLVGALLGGVVALALSGRGVPVARVVAPAVLALIGVGAFLAFMLFATARQTWEFDESHVHHVREGVLGRREWSEPLSAYRGVLKKQELRSTGKSSYMVYMVQLLHEGDKKRTVTLYQSLKKGDLRRKHEHCARLFGMPALTETEDGMEERHPDDLDKTVRELVADGILQVQFDPSVPPPGKRLALRVDGDSLAVQVKAGAIGAVRWVLPVIMASIGVVMIAVSFLPDPPVAIMYAGVALVAGAALLAWALAGLREELRVAPGEVRKWWTWRGKRFAEHAVRGAEIEEVIIAEPLGGKGTKTVQAVSEADTVHFGRALNAAERRWVRDCIIAVISR